ncbi:MAG: DUF4149 domain-containing protein [Gammaproteobacteria bacterium]
MKLRPFAMFDKLSATKIGQRVLLTLWVGGLWATGYLVVPTLFQTLGDPRLAGELAGKLFSVMNYVGLVCGTLLLGVIIFEGERVWQLWVLIAMLALSAIGEFVLQPMIGLLKAETPTGFVEGSPAAAHFAMLHGISSLLFLAASLLGLALVAFGVSRSNTD